MLFRSLRGLFKATRKGGFFFGPGRAQVLCELHLHFLRSIMLNGAGSTEINHKLGFIALFLLLIGALTWKRHRQTLG